VSAACDPFAPGLLHRLDEPPRKVIVLRASRIGDLLCTIPALRALRAALPGAEITLLTLPLLRELALRLPEVDRYAAFPGWPGIAEQLFGARSAARFFAAMRAEVFDLAIQMQGSGVNSNPFTLLLGARATAGFIRPGDPPGRLDAALPWPKAGHEIDRMLAMTTFLGAPSRGRRTAFPLWHEDRAGADALLADAERPLIGIHAGARDATRHWPGERFVAAGCALRRRYGGTLVFLGDDSERVRAERLAGEAGGAALNLAGMTSLPVLGAVIARLALLLTNDTGPAHIAYALGIPSVTIFGGASPDAYGPPPDGPHRLALHAVPCRPRNGSTCPSCAYDLRCLDGVGVERVVAAAEDLLAREAPNVPGGDLSLPYEESQYDVALH
jgi:ADP-heptose:LPS heptosyltransferase